MLKRLALLLILSSTFTGTIATTTGCGSSSGGGGGTGGSGGGGGAGDPDLTCDASPTATTFAKVYSDVITPSCNQTCHKPNVTDGSDSYGLYDTEAKAYEMVGKKSLYAGTTTLKIVEANKLENSAMFQKVLGKMKSPEGKNLGGKMPLGAADLTAAQKKTIKDWICTGAKQ